MHSAVVTRYRYNDIRVFPTLIAGSQATTTNAAKKKADFLSSQIALEKAKNGIQSDFEPFWDLVRSLWISLLAAGSARFERNARDMIQSNFVQQAHVIDSRESWKIH